MGGSNIPVSDSFSASIVVIAADGVFIVGCMLVDCAVVVCAMVGCVVVVVVTGSPSKGFTGVDGGRAHSG